MKHIKMILGTMTFGESVFHPDVEQFITSFLDAGNEELDTAYLYNEGRCEKLLGEVLSQLNRPFKISTKVTPGITGRLDAEAVFKQVNGSLERLNLNSVDTLFLHFPDPKTPVIYALEAIADLHSQGKIKELGLSNYPAWMVADIWHICDRHGWLLPTVFQGVYNPLTRRAESELNACLDNYNMRFYAYNPTCGGLLTGKYGSFDETPPEGRFTHRKNYQERYWKKSFFDAVCLIKTEAEKQNISMIAATYRWLGYHSMLSEKRNDAVLIGASKLTHLQQNMKAMEDGPLPDTMIDVFQEAWQITKGDSPEYFRLYLGQQSPPTSTEKECPKASKTVSRDSSST